VPLCVVPGHRFSMPLRRVHPPYTNSSPSGAVLAVFFFLLRCTTCFFLQGSSHRARFHVLEYASAVFFLCVLLSTLFMRVLFFCLAALPALYLLRSFVQHKLYFFHIPARWSTLVHSH